MLHIYMIGDSTMKFNNIFRYPQTGWGQVLQMFTNNDVIVEDHAENGRSTKSFIAEGRFNVVLSRLNKGDLVICQFGHNDEKSFDLNRYTEPYGEYQANLKYFADEVLKKHCSIIFATPISRHNFVDNVCIDTHKEYRNAMLDFCAKNGHICIDLGKLTLDLYNKIGEKESSCFHMIFPPEKFKNYPDGKDDHSHLNYVGALKICELFVQDLALHHTVLSSLFLDLNEKEIIDEKALID